MPVFPRLAVPDQFQSQVQSRSRVPRLSTAGEHDRRWRVGWGERARTIAEKAGVEKLPAGPKAEPEEVLTRS